MYEEAKLKNQIARHVRQVKVDKYEEDRIGQGEFGSTFGIGGPTNPSTKKKE